MTPEAKKHLVKERKLVAKMWSDGSVAVRKRHMDIPHIFTYGGKRQGSWKGSLSVFNQSPGGSSLQMQL
jgi:hypothetical protein